MTIRFGGMGFDSLLPSDTKDRSGTSQNVPVFLWLPC